MVAVTANRASVDLAGCRKTGFTIGERKIWGRSRLSRPSISALSVTPIVRTIAAGWRASVLGYRFSRRCGDRETVGRNPGRPLQTGPSSCAQVTVRGGRARVSRGVAKS